MQKVEVLTWEALCTWAALIFIWKLQLLSSWKFTKSYERVNSSSFIISFLVWLPHQFLGSLMRKIEVMNKPTLQTTLASAFVLVWATPKYQMTIHQDRITYKVHYYIKTQKTAILYIIYYISSQKELLTPTHCLDGCYLLYCIGLLV